MTQLIYNLLLNSVIHSNEKEIILEVNLIKEKFCAIIIKNKIDITIRRNKNSSFKHGLNICQQLSNKMNIQFHQHIINNIFTTILIVPI